MADAVDAGVKRNEGPTGETSPDLREGDARLEKETAGNHAMCFGGQFRDPGVGRPGFVSHNDT